MPETRMRLLILISWITVVGCTQPSTRVPVPIEDQQLSFRIDVISSPDLFSGFVLAGPSPYDSYEYQGFDEHFHYASNPFKRQIIAISVRDISADEIRQILRTQSKMYDRGEIETANYTQYPINDGAIAMNHWFLTKELDDSLSKEAR